MVVCVALPASAAPLKKTPAPDAPGLVVVDGAGRRLGPVVHVEDPLYDAQGVYTVEAAPDRRRRGIRARRASLPAALPDRRPYLDGTSRVFFQSCDCSGSPLIRAEPTGQFGSLFTPLATGTSHKLYLATQSAESATRTAVCSLLTADTGCEPVSDGGGSPEEIVVPTELVGQLPVHRAVSRRRLGTDRPARRALV